MRALESRPGSLGGMPDDHLGTVAVSLAVSELQWTPDVAPAVMDRIARDAVAYPEQFDRRARPAPPRAATPPGERSARRAIGRLTVFAVLLAVVAAFVVLIASVNVADAAASVDALRSLAVGVT